MGQSFAKLFAKLSSIHQSRTRYGTLCQRCRYANSIKFDSSLVFPKLFVCGADRMLCHYSILSGWHQLSRVGQCERYIHKVLLDCVAVQCVLGSVVQCDFGGARFWMTVSYKEIHWSGCWRETERWKSDLNGLLTEST